MAYRLRHSPPLLGRCGVKKSKSALESAMKPLSPLYSYLFYHEGEGETHGGQQSPSEQQRLDGQQSPPPADLHPKAGGAGGMPAVDVGGATIAGRQEASGTLEGMPAVTRRAAATGGAKFSGCNTPTAQLYSLLLIP